MLKKHGGFFLAYGDTAVTLESAHLGEGRIVILQLPSEAAAQSWLVTPSVRPSRSSVERVPKCNS